MNSSTKAGRAWKLEQIPHPATGFCGYREPVPFQPRSSATSAPVRSISPAAPPRAAPGLIVCTVQPRGARGAAQAPPTPYPPQAARPGSAPRREPGRQGPRPGLQAVRARPEGHAGRRENGAGSVSRAPRSLLSRTSRARRRSTHRGSPSALPEPCAPQPPPPPPVQARRSSPER